MTKISAIIFALAVSALLLALAHAGEAKEDRTSLRGNQLQDVTGPNNGHYDNHDKKHYDNHDKKHYDNHDKKHYDNHDKKHYDNNDKKHYDNHDNGHHDNHNNGHHDMSCFGYDHQHCSHVSHCYWCESRYGKYCMPEGHHQCYKVATELAANGDYEDYDEELVLNTTQEDFEDYEDYDEEDEEEDVTDLGNNNHHDMSCWGLDKNNCSHSSHCYWCEARYGKYCMPSGHHHCWSGALEVPDDHVAAE